MSFWKRKDDEVKQEDSVEQASAERRAARLDSDASDDDGSVRGERGIPSVNPVRSIHSRIGSILALGLMCALALGLLAWYYTSAWKRSEQTREGTETAAANRAKGDSSLPALGKMESPTRDISDQAALDSLFGPAPPLPPRAALSWAASGNADKEQDVPTVVVRAKRNKNTPTALERRLAGPVFTAAEEKRRNESELQNALASSGGVASADLHAAAWVSARVLATQRWLLPTGAFIDCTLETAIDSTLPGRTTCITATDTFGADGEVVLLERGTKLIGETRGQLQHGQSRIFVIWTEARTPTGVMVPLESPGTDELGRSGLPGRIKRHFWDRFGAALLVSTIDGSVQSIGRLARDGNTVILNPLGSKEIATEVLKSTINIPPTVVKHHGDRIQVLVARDIDFRSVYELRPSRRSDEYCQEVLGTEC
jgi:type IV secretion system protein VirB10